MVVARVSDPEQDNKREDYQENPDPKKDRKKPDTILTTPREPSYLYTILYDSITPY